MIIQNQQLTREQLTTLLPFFFRGKSLSIGKMRFENGCNIFTVNGLLKGSPKTAYVRVKGLVADEPGKVHVDFQWATITMCNYRVPLA